MPKDTTIKIIIAGSRNADIHLIDIEAAIFNSKMNITEVVSGYSGNVDLMGEKWAVESGLPIKLFEPDWSKGKKAGPMRNRQMADYAEGLIAVWDGESRGTMNMIDEAHKLGKKIWVERI